MVTGQSRSRNKNTDSAVLLKLRRQINRMNGNISKREVVILSLYIPGKTQDEIRASIIIMFENELISSIFFFKNLRKVVSSFAVKN